MAANMVEENRPTNLKAFLAAGTCEYDPSVRTEEFAYPSRRKRAGAFHLENELEQTSDVMADLTSRRQVGPVPPISTYIKPLHSQTSENSMMTVRRRLSTRQAPQEMRMAISTSTIKEGMGSAALSAGLPVQPKAKI